MLLATDAHDMPAFVQATLQEKLREPWELTAGPFPGARSQRRPMSALSGLKDNSTAHSLTTLVPETFILQPLCRTHRTTIITRTLEEMSLPMSFPTSRSLFLPSRADRNVNPQSPRKSNFQHTHTTIIIMSSFLTIVLPTTVSLYFSRTVFGQLSTQVQPVYVFIHCFFSNWILISISSFTNVLWSHSPRQLYRTSIKFRFNFFKTLLQC